MLLSIQQRYILEAMRKLGCMRRDQLLILTRERFRRSDLIISERRMEAMLRQLRNGVADFRLEGDLVTCTQALPNAQRLEAIDVMLELTGGTPLDFQGRLRHPLLLQFTWEQAPGSIRPVTIADLPPAEQGRMERLEQYRRARVVWLCGDNRLPKDLSLPSNHFIAIRKADGLHVFYGSNGL